MRLLHVDEAGEFVLTEFSGDKSCPPYAILSHRWGQDEVTFKDITKKRYRTKSGYTKIRFCIEEALRNGLQYSWVDTCCIDKGSSIELSEAINSMFKWYQGAAKCLVYLSDVTSKDVHEPLSQILRDSSWFTRGWTLQELLAPPWVEFFDRSGVRLGDKMSLEHEINDITQIPLSVLRGSSLSTIPAEKKLRWAQSRKTTHPEDWAYSLLGILGVNMPPLYGEGETNAVHRLLQEVAKNKTHEKEPWWQSLRATQPRMDKLRLERLEGGLLPDLQSWIMESNEFRTWQRTTASNLLWIYGKPGTGKTLLSCEIINELEKLTAGSSNVAFFFCQAADSHKNNGTAVLQGLLHFVDELSPLVIPEIRLERTVAGKDSLEDANSFEVMSEIFLRTTKDRSFRITYMIVDAFDECIEGSRDLLNFITQMVHSTPQVKWLITSRHISWIEHDLRAVESRLDLSMESSSPMALLALRRYVEYKVARLVEKGKCEVQARDGICDQLCESSDGNLLWIDLTSRALETNEGLKVPHLELPKSLGDMYQRSMDKIHCTQNSDLLLWILATVAIRETPITLSQLRSLSETRGNGYSETLLRRHIESSCSTFLTVSDSTVSLVHRTAREFLTNNASYIFTALEATRSVSRKPPDYSRSNQDSGYVSATQPATSVDLPDTVDEGASLRLRDPAALGDSDIDSLVSEDDDIRSQLSGETSKESLTGQALVSTFLVEDDRFRALCQKGYVFMDRQRLTSNLRRLLRSFYKNLLTEAATDAEKAMSGLLRSRKRRLWISHRLVMQIEEGQDQIQRTEGVLAAEEDKLDLERWLASVAESPNDLPEQDSENEDSDDELPESDSPSEFPFTTGLRNFLRQSDSLQSLVRDFALWLLPARVRDVLMSIPSSDICITDQQSISLINSIKCWVEDNTGAQWNWWPLEGRKRVLYEGECRLFWRCTCRKRQWMEVSAEQRNQVDMALNLLGDVPLLSHWCAVRKGWSWASCLARISRSIPAASSTTSSPPMAGRYAPSNNPAAQSSLAPSSQHSAVIASSAYQQPTSATVIQIQTGGQISYNQAWSYILLGVPAGGPRLVPAQVPVYTFSTDSSIFRTLKSCYRAQRGLMRLWFSIWSLQYCSAVKFSRLNVSCMVHDREDLPEDIEYEYTPRKGHKDAENPPLNSHLFEALYYACDVPCTRRLPHSCLTLPGNTYHVARLPKRATSFRTDQTSPIWGLEAAFAVSAMHVVAWHVVIMAGPFAFFGWWVDAHPLDLQTAIVPATIAGGALSLFWMLSGILTSKKEA